MKKPKNPEASVKMQEIGRWLAARGMQVYVEKAVHSTEFQVRSVHACCGHVRACARACVCICCVYARMWYYACAVVCLWGGVWGGKG